jgi:hypothetical protein
MKPPLLPSTFTATAVTASSAAACTATVNGVDVPVSLARDLTVAAGDILLVHLVVDRYVGCCRLFTAAPTPDPVDPADPLVPDPNTALVTGRTVVLPTFTGTYRDGVWLTSTTDTLQGEYGGYGNATGVAVYGDKPATLAGATVLHATVRLARGPGGAAGPVGSTLWLVTETDQPAGAPTLTLSTAGPALEAGEDVDAFDVPVAWVQAMADGTAGGLALHDADGDPYVRMDGRGTDPAAWILTVDWERIS